MGEVKAIKNDAMRFSLGKQGRRTVASAPKVSMCYKSACRGGEWGGSRPGVQEGMAVICVEVGKRRERRKPKKGRICVGVRAS